MVWKAVLNNASTEIIVSRIDEEDISYLIGGYQMSTISYKFWLEGTYSYAALFSSNVEIIRSSSNPESKDYGNEILGFTDPNDVLAAYSVISGTSTSGLPLAASVNNFPTTQAVSAAALPLPADAASETTSAAILTQLQTDLAVLKTNTISAGSGTSITQADVRAAIESATNLDQLEALLGNLGTYVDGLESLNTTLNTYVDGLEGLETAIRDKLNAVSFATDTLQATGNISLGSIDSKITQLIDRIQNPGRGYSSTVTGTRAANTTAYAANDIYGSILKFTNIGAPGGVVKLDNLQIVFNIAAVPAGMGTFRLYLYNTPPPSNVADNGAFSIPAGDRSSILTPQSILLGTGLAIGGGSVVGAINNINIQVKLAAGSTSLWAYLLTSTAFTPAAISQTHTITLSTLGL